MDRGDQPTPRAADATVSPRSVACLQDPLWTEVHRPGWRLTQLPPSVASWLRPTSRWLRFGPPARPSRTAKTKGVLAPPCQLLTLACPLHRRPPRRAARSRARPPPASVLPQRSIETGATPRSAAGARAQSSRGRARTRPGQSQARPGTWPSNPRPTRPPPSRAWIGQRVEARRRLVQRPPRDPALRPRLETHCNPPSCRLPPCPRSASSETPGIRSTLPMRPPQE